jgi:hypothetical protein
MIDAFHQGYPWRIELCVTCKHRSLMMEGFTVRIESLVAGPGSGTHSVIGAFAWAYRQRTLGPFGCPLG